MAKHENWSLSILVRGNSDSNKLFTSTRTHKFFGSKMDFSGGLHKKRSFLLLFNLDVWEFAKAGVKILNSKFSTDLIFDAKIGVLRRLDC